MAVEGMTNALYPLLGVLSSAILTMIGVVYTSRSSRRVADKNADLEGRKVDAAAYDRARKIDEGVLDTLREDLAAHKATITELRAELTTVKTSVKTEIEAAATRIRVLEQHTEDCWRKRTALIRRLDAAGVPVTDEERT